jgi:2',3'-cyclic-nucleotide 2'-phosphodiesterase (5'-nucleotidase family)
MIKNEFKTEFNTEDLIFNLEGVDAILDGHSHAIYNTTSKDKKGKDIQINQVGTNLQAIGTLIIKEDANIISEIISEVPEPKNKANATKIKRDKERWVNTEMYNFINNLWTDYEDELNIQFGYSDFDFIIKPEEDSIPLCRYQECTLGNLITDAVKTLGNGEFTIVNGGSIRNNMYKGNLTRGGIINALPWFNNIVLKRVTGQCILDALEYGVSKLPNGGGLLQISGITFDADVSFESSVLTDASGMFANVTGKRRVSNVKINGKDLEIDKLYNASLLEYNANGGGGYSMFVPFDVFNESLVTDTDALCFFIQQNLNGNIPEEYKNVQGRININYNSSSSKNSSNSVLKFVSISSLIIIIIMIFLKLF